MNTEFIALSAIINFPKGIIEEHANTFLERKNNPLFSHQFHDDSEESDTDKQCSSDDCHVNVNKEKIPEQM